MGLSRRFRGWIFAAAALGVCFSFAAQAAVFTSAGATPGDIQATVDAFRAALGANNGVGGSFATGRREINWDGVPDVFSAANFLPGDFFNVNSARGAVLSTPGTGLQVSANAGVGPIEFDNINPTYSGLFQPFSAQRLFTAVGSNVVDIFFFVPGTNTPAMVAGFGAVFTDANTAAAARFTVFLGNGANGGQFAVPTSVAGGLSFLGLTDPLGYSHIRIQSGNAALGPNQALPSIDLIAMDDFIYGEPIALEANVPEPGTLLLTAAGAVLLLAGRRRR